MSDLCLCLSKILHVSQVDRLTTISRFMNVELENIARDIRPKTESDTTRRLATYNSQQCLSRCWVLKLHRQSQLLWFEVYIIQFYYAIYSQLFSSSSSLWETTAEMLYTQTRTSNRKKASSSLSNEKRESRVRENCNVWPTKDIQIGSWTWSDILQWWKMYECLNDFFSLFGFAFCAASRT